MYIECWITKATKNTLTKLRIYNIYFCYTATLAARGRLILDYTYIACLVLITRNWPTLSYPIFQSFQNLTVDFVSDRYQIA